MKKCVIIEAMKTTGMKKLEMYIGITSMLSAQQELIYQLAGKKI